MACGWVDVADVTWSGCSRDCFGRRHLLAVVVLLFSCVLFFLPFCPFFRFSVRACLLAGAFFRLRFCAALLMWKDCREPTACACSFSED